MAKVRIIKDHPGVDQKKASLVRREFNAKLKERKRPAAFDFWMAAHREPDLEAEVLSISGSYEHDVIEVPPDLEEPPTPYREFMPGPATGEITLSVTCDWRAYQVVKDEFGCDDPTLLSHAITVPGRRTLRLSFDGFLIGLGKFALDADKETVTFDVTIKPSGPIDGM
jgi:hypothetical protein